MEPSQRKRLARRQSRLLDELAELESQELADDGSLPNFDVLMRRNEVRAELEEIAAQLDPTGGQRDGKRNA